MKVTGNSDPGLLFDLLVIFTERKLMKLRSFTLAIAAVSFALNAGAAVSKPLADWGKGPASWFMTADEKTAWKNVSNDQEAQQFVDLFWARRDPTPGTARNEFHEMFDQRAALADKNFTVGKKAGSMTERGQVLLLVGPPSRIKSVGNAAFQKNESGVATNDESVNDNAPPTQTWIYEKDTMPPFASGGDFQVRFVDRMANGEYRAEPNTGRINVKELLNTAVQSYLKQPNLTVADLQSQKSGAKTETVTVPAPVVTTAPASNTATAFKNAAYGTAVSSFKAASSNPYKDVFVTYGEGVTASGEYFVPVQIYFGRNAGLKADTPVTFFGQVEDASGKVVAVVEEPGTLVGSKNDVYFDKSLVLPSGEYTGYFGVADSTGKILGVAKSPMTLSSIDKSAAGAGKLILTNNLYALPKAQMATDPFAFGGLKVVPKGDRAFRKDDELDYFVELRNPGIDPTTSKPHIQAKVTITDEKGKSLQGPVADADVQPVKGVEGHWWIGSGYSVADFAPGKYTMKVTLTDKVTQAKYTLEEPFRVVGEK